MDGERRIASQGHRSADVARKLLGPGRMLLKHPDEDGMNDEGQRSAPFAGGAAEECAGLERGTIRRKLE